MTATNLTSGASVAAPASLKIAGRHLRKWIEQSVSEITLRE